jgi:hypothetical protein
MNSVAYRRSAAECRLRAAEARSDDERLDYLHMASMWEKLASESKGVWVRWLARARGVRRSDALHGR